MIKQLDNALHGSDDILVYNEDFDKVTFIANQRHILAVDLYKTNLDNDNNFDEVDPDTIIDVVAMRSPLGPTLANAFLCFHEQIWLNKCPDEFKPAYYRRYVDEIFVLCRSPDHLEKFKSYLNSKHRNFRFTCEQEQINSMFFLDVLITRTSNGFKTSVHHKPTFKGVYSIFYSFISEEYKVGLIFIFLFRTFSVV